MGQNVECQNVEWDKTSKISMNKEMYLKWYYFFVENYKTLCMYNNAENGLKRSIVRKYVFKMILLFWKNY
jgi:hypothetical protein